MFERHFTIKTNHKNIYAGLSSEYIKKYMEIPNDTEKKDGFIEITGQFPTLDKKSSEKIKVNVYYETFTRKDNQEWIVFINGFSSSVALWEFQKGFFLRNGFNLLLYDQVGQGQSSKPENVIYDIKFQVGCLKELLEFLDLKNFILYGLSGGGMIALEFAKDYQKMIKCLMLVTTGYQTQGKLKLLLNQFVKILNLSLNDIERMELFYNTLIMNIFSDNFIHNFNGYIGQMIKNNMERNTVACLLGAMKGLLDFDCEKELTQIKVPTIIVSAMHDGLFTTHQSYIMNQIMPNSKRIIFKGVNASHALVIEMFESLNDVMLYEMKTMDSFSPSKLSSIVDNTYIKEEEVKEVGFFLNF